jgi:hypothetical protein
MVIEGGTVYPELNFTLPDLEIKKDTMPKVCAHYRQIVGEALQRAAELEAPGVVRVKGIFQTSAGPRSVQAVSGGPLETESSAYCADSRLEVLSAPPGPEAGALEAALRNAALNPGDLAT